MTKDEGVATLLNEWWGKVVFPGKEHCTLQGDGVLVLYPGDKSKERILTTLTPETADSIVQSLVARFAEVQQKFDELRSEWQSVEDDKHRLAGKIARFRTYLSEVQALGHFEPLWTLVEEWEQLVHNLSEASYKAKLKLVEEAESWMESEDWKEATAFFRGVTEKWKQTKSTSRKQTEALWQRLEAARTKFFDRKRAYFEDKEEDMLLNLDIKLELVEKAEALALSDKWKETTEVFRQLMEEWKAAGRTLAGKNEELWQRFINAKNKFFDRKREHFEQVQQEQEANYLQKLALVEQAEQLKNSTDWTQTSQIFAELTERWKAIGKVPVEKLEELRTRFFAAKDAFFDARRAHYDAVMSSLEENYQKKKALLDRAESLRNSNQWHTTTEAMNQLMAEWKQIGPVPHKYGDSLWKQFLEARAAFFKRKDEHRKLRKEQQKLQQERRREQAIQFLHTLKEELKEEEARLADFREGLANVTPGPKEGELRKHLESLIEQCQHVIARKQQKISEVQTQLELEPKESVNDINTSV